MIRTIFAKLKGEAAFLVLLAVAAVGAYLYVQARQARADRDRVVHWAEVTCAASGTTYASAAKAKPGEACTDQVAGLARFKATSDQRTAQLLAQALADHDARQIKDTNAALAAAQAARSAAALMEAADAKAERTNLVDADWFAALNRTAGLRPTPTR